MARPFAAPLGRAEGRCRVRGTQMQVARNANENARAGMIKCAWRNKFKFNLRKIKLLDVREGVENRLCRRAAGGVAVVNQWSA